MKAAITTETVERVFGGSAIAALENYIRIPNQSPSFDPEIHTNGLQEKAVTLIVEWVLAQNIRGKHESFFFFFFFFFLSDFFFQV
jgi:hypothetical protein